MQILFAHHDLNFISDVMSKEPKEHIVDNLVSCGVSFCAFNMVKDLNTKLALLQQINKEYNALAHKLENGNITINDLDVAEPAAKERLPSEIHRRDDFGLDTEAAEKLGKICPSKVEQIINFLKQKRVMEIINGIKLLIEPKDII